MPVFLSMGTLDPQPTADWGVADPSDGLCASAIVFCLKHLLNLRTHQAPWTCVFLTSALSTPSHINTAA